jgi:uncharacterized protein YbjT (DUF2867 family)
MNNLTALLIGATGATGSEVLNQLLLDANFSKVLVFSRRPIVAVHPKLEVHVVDFEEISNWSNLIKGDVLFSAVGTTLKVAGSKSNQFKIDYTFQYETAKVASENGVGVYVLVSSYGANEKSGLFYPRMKGQLDKAVQDLNFKQVHIFRPGILGRQTEKLRPLERVSITIINKLNKLGLFRSQRPMPVALLAQKMLMVSSLISPNKTNIYSLDKIFEI